MSADIAAVKIDQLRQEIRELRNEIARLNNRTNWVCTCGGTNTEGQRENEEQAVLLSKGAEREARLLGKIGELQSANAALREDKARLDWLDEKNCWLTIPGSTNFRCGDKVRDVIDDAMKDAKP